MKNLIVGSAESPRELEKLYRADPGKFRQAFSEAFAARSDSKVLQAWHERLLYEESGDEIRPATVSRLTGRDIGVTVALSLIAGTLMKLPHLLPWLDGEKFHSRNAAGICVGALALYFCIQKVCRTRFTITVMALFLGAILYLNFLPGSSDAQTVILSCMHMPFFLWSLLGIVFLRGAWKNMSGRMDYVRYNGELLIYSTIVLLGGMVLTGLTFALFELIDLNIEKWYLENVVVYGATASPIVATLLVERVVRGRLRIAPLLAKVFTPLFLLTVVAYLIAMILKQKSPFTDRDFLIAFNGLLLVVLGLSVFSISERGQGESGGIVDVMNIGLVSVTLAIDIIALAAIMFRLTSYGFTPNRLAVLGANLLAFCHLAGILHRYIRFFRKKTSLECLEGWIVGYIPAYTAWSIVVAAIFPIAFRFQ